MVAAVVGKGGVYAMVMDGRTAAATTATAAAAADRSSLHAGSNFVARRFTRCAPEGVAIVTSLVTPLDGGR